jgi:hypothetical protein
MWFRIILEDGSTAYTYRARLAHEDGFLLANKDVSLIMQDGSTVDFETLNFFWDVKTHINDDLAHYNIYLSSSYYEGNNHTAYSKDLSREIDLPFNAYIINSPHKKWFIGSQQIYGDDVASLILMDFVDDEFIELFRVNMRGVYPESIEWASDEKLSFILENSDDTYPATLELVDGEWLLTTDYVFNVE